MSNVKSNKATRQDIVEFLDGLSEIDITIYHEGRESSRPQMKWQRCQMYVGDHTLEISPLNILRLDYTSYGWVLSKDIPETAYWRFQDISISGTKCTKSKLVLFYKIDNIRRLIHFESSKDI